MTALALALLFFWIAAAIGRTLLNKLSLFIVWSLEATAYAAALGLGIASYGVYIIGLMGLLTFWPVTLWWLFLAVAGWQGTRSNWADVWQVVSRLRNKSLNHEKNHLSLENSKAVLSSGKANQIITVMCFSLLVIFGVISVMACFRPPGPFEWDAISYHLADPKLFLLQHRIVSLPTEHHSNFPFTMEMLYTVGLLYNGYALANLFHAIMAFLMVLGMISFCRRTLAPLVGWLASTAFISTPIVLWEASTAYIDIGLALYLTLAAFACISAILQQRAALAEQASPPTVTNVTASVSLSSWMMLAGVMMGFGLGVKYLALVPLALITLLLGLNRIKLKLIAIFIAIALIIGSPWYLKSAIVMSNPVYPFYYNVFPKTKYWSSDRAAAYQSEQNKFGTKSISTDARSKILNLASVPWDLLTQRRGGVLYCNPGEYTFTALYGGLFAGLIFPLAFLRRVPRTIRYLLWLALGQIFFWFFLSQVGRYLIQSMPLLAIVGAYTAFAWTQPTWAFPKENQKDRLEPDALSEPLIVKSIENRQPSLSSTIRTLPGWIGIALIFGQAVYVLLSISFLPMNPGKEDADLVDKGQLHSSISLSTMLAKWGQPQGWEEDLTRYYGPYEAIKWINSNTPSTSGVVLYEETRGFYLDRFYVWGNQQHSAFIPYETLSNGQELTDWMNKLGIHYALINLEEMSQNQTNPRDPEFPRGTNGNEIVALHKWYAVESKGKIGDKGHQLVADAIQSELWRAVHWKHGCVVLEIGNASDALKNAANGELLNAAQQAAQGAQP